MNTLRDFMLKDLTPTEMESYKQYTRHNNTMETDWITKVSKQRDAILSLDPRCNCGGYININEYGNGKCSIGHNTNRILNRYIKLLQHS